MFLRLFVLLQYVIPQQLLSKLCGLLAGSRFSTMLIPLFIKVFKVNMDEAVRTSPSDYKTFNDFFIRQLKDGARLIDETSILCSPADGHISQAGSINEKRLIQAKGIDYALEELVACDETLINHFANAHFMTIYLSPRDYHRVHSPVDARVKRMIYVPGKLFSVNDATTLHKKNLFSRNERLIIELDSEIGPCCVILVGAMIVGNMNVMWHGDIKRSHKIRHYDYQDKTITLKKGQELGHFKLGSTVIVLTKGTENNLDTFWKKQSGCDLQLGEKIA